MFGDQWKTSVCTLLVIGVIIFLFIYSFSFSFLFFFGGGDL